MIYIITNYSTNSYDSSFADVHAKVADTPMNFLYQSLDSVMSILTELAYQCRCAIYLVEDVFHLKFLADSDFGDPVDTLTEPDIDVGSMAITTTPTEDLITVYEATFRPDYSPTYSEPIKAIFRSNVAIYGYHKDSHDFFALNSFPVVEKVAKFWFLRKTMSWKILNCKVYLDKLGLEVYDTVTLDFARPWLGKGTIKGYVLSADYNPKDHMIDLSIRTNVRLGEISAYKEDTFIPFYQPVQGGSAGGTSGGERFPMPPANGIQIKYDFGKPNRTEQGEQGGITIPTEDDWLPAQIFTPTGLSIPDLGDYQFEDPKETPNEPSFPHAYCYPGIVNEYRSVKNGKQEYSVTIYYHGTQGGKSSEVGAVQLQLDTDDRIPAGTWVLISSNTFKDGVDDAGKIKYSTERTIQVPIWLRVIPFILSLYQSISYLC